MTLNIYLILVNIEFWAEKNHIEKCVYFDNEKHWNYMYILFLVHPEKLQSSCNQTSLILLLPFSFNNDMVHPECRINLSLINMMVTIRDQLF